MLLRWIWNSTFWMGVKNFKKYIVLEVVKCYLFHIGPNQSLRSLDEDLMWRPSCGLFPKWKQSDQWFRKFWQYCLMVRIWPKRGVCLKNKCGLFQKAAGDFGLKDCNFYHNLSLETVFQSIHLPRNCNIMNIGSHIQKIYTA